MALLRFGTLLLLCAPSAAHRAVTHVNHLDSESAEVLQAAKPPPEKLTPLQWRLQLIPDTACGDEKYTKKGAILQRACSGGAIKKYRPNPIITFQEFADELDKSGPVNPATTSACWLEKLDVWCSVVIRTCRWRTASMVGQESQTSPSNLSPASVTVASLNWLRPQAFGITRRTATDGSPRWQAGCSDQLVIEHRLRCFVS
eukprot:TRINITY_DN25155_c0_g2_i6.p1 TRINITY_DN25155_c0_g2~~TRINITY_DN25155_c0_g2_i6.p1  ORF type:complete len:201 (-),score=15.02 TRINITY_DN25155_c0_g2_i6:234-836(-)